MADCMKNVAKNRKTLTVEERNLLSVAYKNVIGSRRASWRIVSSLEQKESEGSKADIIRDCKKVIEKELTEITKSVLSLLDDTLLSELGAEDHEGKVFYLKM